MRRRKKQQVGSLDSLLDTMTNVVGILVILLTVTQLGVRDAVKRIETTQNIDSETFAQIETAVQDLATEELRLEERTRELRATVAEADLETRRRAAERSIEDETNNIANLTVGIAGIQEEVDRTQEDLLALLEQQRLEREELEKRRVELSEEEARLQTLLAELGTLALPDAEIVYLPNPRPAPEGAESLVFLCRQERILPADTAQLHESAVRRVSYILRTEGLGRNPAEGIDPEILTSKFNEGPIIEDNFFRAELIESRRVPQLVFHNLDGAGETAEELTELGSRYRRLLAQINPQRRYIKFLVWPDGFECYLAARQLCMEKRIAAGWDFRYVTSRYTENLPGNLRLGPPPPPAPPRPPGEDPPPAPPTRPKPVDTID